MIAEVGIVTIISVLLIAGGLALFGLTVWFWKTSRPEPRALARLEIMSERAYRKSSGVDRQFLLEMAEREARESSEKSSALAESN
ncbi:MAG: hypothetical protein EBU67_02115 [Actinobacteria bacterium]|nr:hypothetical protein [Actinomycetota bacterium]NBP53085.1 hypothetical protein [Actinomycetota bacterium]